MDPILLLRYACLGVLFSDLITKDKVQKIAFQMLYNRALSHTYVLFDAIGHLIFNHITFVHTFFIVEKKEQHSSFFYNGIITSQTYTHNKNRQELKSNLFQKPAQIFKLCPKLTFGF